MNIVLLSGGLGNQMFQYAFALSLSDKISHTYISDYIVRREKQHNGIDLPNVFNIKYDNPFYMDLIVRLIRKIRIFRRMRYLSVMAKTMEQLLSAVGVSIFVEENNYSFKSVDSFLNGKSNLLWGYWQSPNYFSAIENVIRQSFRFDINRLSHKSKIVLDDIHCRESVSLHIRRGDFLNKENIDIFGGICTIAYYKKAIQVLEKHVATPCFYVFSDDIAWVKENLSLSNAIFVDWNKGIDSWQDMCLMSNCKHNIIANSTFSWWGAWLNNNQKKVIVSPERFTNNIINEDLIPNEWIKI